MTGGSWNEKQVFLHALELPPLEQRTYLESACPTREARSRIEALLACAAAGRGLTGREPPAGDAPAPGASGAPGAGAPMPLRGVDEFEFIRELGRGGMGVVYLARDRALGRLTAVKVLAPHLVDSEQAVERFRQEARAVAALNHPGIVPVYRAACSGGHHYIAMEYIAGETLHERIRNARPSSGDSTPTGELPAIFRDPELVRRTTAIVADVAEVLDHAHRNGVIHRDVKPSNIILDSAGQPHLTDFGIAKVDGGSALTTPGDLAGTVHYMSPEQTSDAPDAVDRRSDIFSLGVVLYELLALRRPFEGSSNQKVIHAIRHHEPPDLRTANAIVPVDLATICHKALEKRPQNRYQSAAHLAADLRAFLAGDPILARPPSALRRARRWAKRHRAGLGSALVACGAVLTAGGAYLGVNVLDRGRTGTIHVVSDPGDASRALLRRLGADGVTLASPIDLGLLPARIDVEPGVYRLVVTAGDGRFAETTVPLTSAGDIRRIALVPPRGNGSRFIAAGVDGPFERVGWAPPLSEEMVFIPGGECDCGVEDRPEPQGLRRVRVAPFFIDRTEVSNGDYMRYVAATGAAPPPWWNLVGFDAVPAELPVVGISWEEAEAYARWAGKRLPTAAEWECAMRAPDGRLTPWADAPVDVPTTTLEAVRRAASGGLNRTLPEYLAHALPVSSRPDLATPAGLLHGATNVSEWTATILPGRTTVVVVKGASWANDPKLADLASLRTFPLETIADGHRMEGARSMMIGFRCVRSAAP